MHRFSLILHYLICKYISSAFLERFVFITKFLVIFPENYGRFVLLSDYCKNFFLNKENGCFIAKKAIHCSEILSCIVSDNDKIKI